MGAEQFGQGNVWASAKEAGIWKNIPFDVNNFKCQTMGWTIVPSDVQVNKYCRIGNTVIWNISISNLSALSGGPDNFLSMIAPVRYTNFNLTSTCIGHCFNTTSKLILVQALADNSAFSLPTHARVSIAPSAALTAGFFHPKFTLVYDVTK